MRAWTDDPAPLGAARVLAGWVFVVMALVIAGSGTSSGGQLGALLSPGALANAHAGLEGGTKCQQCHEAGRKVTAARCLVCHKPIADRIPARRGVHQNVTECVSCHVDHTGRDGDLRHFDTRAFDHAAQTGFRLDGLHARSSVTCSSCHKGRSFLEARQACSSCHADSHKGSLGGDCTRCHSASTPFKESRATFDHSTARFPLTGGHREVACAQCHKTSIFRDVTRSSPASIAACTNCHEDRHRGTFGSTCASCHTTAGWNTRNVTHAKTRFPLVGAHAVVACEKCHRSGSMTTPIRFERCASCHANVHRENLADDCGSCHTESGFKGATFDHATRTSFSLVGKHDGLACVACHTTVSDARVPLAQKVLDYRGAQTTCVGCHAEKDPHKGAFGRACDACHQPVTFKAGDFVHPRSPEFYGGQHGTVRCEQCHVPDNAPRPAKATAPAMACVSCHNDVHLGQLGATCEQCHSVSGAKFVAPAFSHERARFTLTGKHQDVACAGCHRPQTGLFPSRTGTAVAYRPIPTECRTCHADPHLGQVGAQCDSCHDASTFAITSFEHTGLDDFFRGFHGRYTCASCHKKETGAFPAGQGTAVRFLVGRECVACHRQY